MNDPFGKDDLLNEVLGEASPEDFRARLLAGTLREAGRRRRWRKARRVGGLLVVLAMLATVPRRLWFSEKRVGQEISMKASAEKSYHLVETRPLGEGAVVSNAGSWRVTRIENAPGVTMVATRGGNFRYINDNELLALFEGRAVALVRTGPDTEELVFADK